MRENKLTVKLTTQFKKDYKSAMKCGLKITLLDEIVALPAMGEALSEMNKDHALADDWAVHRLKFSALP